MSEVPTTEESFPEHEKLLKVAQTSQVIGEFLTENGHGWVLAEYTEDDTLVPVALSVVEVLATYFDIDLRKIEAEKQQMLNIMRALSEPET